MASLIDETQQQLESQARDLRLAINRVQQASLMQKTALAISAIEDACDLLDVIIADRGNTWQQLESLDSRVTGLESINGIL